VPVLVVVALVLGVPVLVVVALVLGVPVLVVQVVEVIAVLHCLVAATFSVVALMPTVTPAVTRPPQRVHAHSAPVPALTTR